MKKLVLTLAVSVALAPAAFAEQYKNDTSSAVKQNLFSRIFGGNADTVSTTVTTENKVAEDEVLNKFLNARRDMRANYNTELVAAGTPEGRDAVKAKYRAIAQNNGGANPLADIQPAAGGGNPFANIQPAAGGIAQPAVGVRPYDEYPR